MENEIDDGSQELQKILTDLRQSQQRAQNLQNQMNYLSNSVEELKVTIETIQGMKKLDSQTDILVPIGSNSFLRAKLVEADKVLSGFGAELVAERDPDQAIKFLDDQKKEFNESIEQIEEEMENIQEHIEELRPKAEELMSKMENKEESAIKSGD